ncbi:MAG: LysR family transcriptional regulator [Methyloligellaceae bacterium]
MSELEEIRVFVQLVESSNATRAAEKLGVAVSAVSRRMKDLETRLGVQLLNRTTRRMNLTEAGAIYFRRCRQIIDDFEEAQSEVSQLSRNFTGGLRIAAPMSFGQAHLLPAIASFMHQYPNMNIDLDMNDRQVNLVEEGVDVAIRVGELKDSSLMARRLASISFAVTASQGFLDRYGVPATPADLSGMPALCYSNLSTPGAWDYVSKDGEKGQVRVEPRMLINNGDAIREAAISGLGIACGPTFIVHSALERGLLKPVLQDWNWGDVNLYAIYPPTRHLSARVRLFIDFLAERFSGVPYWERGEW